MSGWTLTVRHGPKVSKVTYPSLELGLAALREQAEAIRSRGDLPEVSVIRTYEPADRVNARLELKTGGRLRRRGAGLDVMGDGSLVPFAGGALRRKLAVGGGSAYDALAEELNG